MREMYGIVNVKTGAIRSNSMSQGPDRIVWEREGDAMRYWRRLRSSPNTYEVQKIYLVPESKVNERAAEEEPINTEREVSLNIHIPTVG